MDSKKNVQNRGAVLLRDFKALVDSFPDERRREIIKLIDVVFRRLSTHCSEDAESQAQAGDLGSPPKIAKFP